MTMKIDKRDGKLQMTEISLTPTLTIVKDEDREKANRILLKTEKACLISNSIKSKVIMTPTINISTDAAEPIENAHRRL